MMQEVKFEFMLMERKKEESSLLHRKSTSMRESSGCAKMKGSECQDESHTWELISEIKTRNWQTNERTEKQRIDIIEEDERIHERLT